MIKKNVKRKMIKNYISLFYIFGEKKKTSVIKKNLVKINL